MKLLNRISFLIAFAFTCALDHVFGRALAINATPLTPTETSHGTESMDADSGAITYKNALVKKGSDDRHFVVVSTTQTDIPYGVLLNDEVVSGEEGTVRKNIAVLGLWPDSLPMVSDGAATIGAGDRVIHSATTAGNVRKMPTTSGQIYVVIGRSRFAVAATAGDPVSVVHCVPYLFTNP